MYLIKLHISFVTYTSLSTSLMRNYWHKNNMSLKILVKINLLSFSMLCNYFQTIYIFARMCHLPFAKHCTYFPLSWLCSCYFPGVHHQHLWMRQGWVYSFPRQRIVSKWRRESKNYWALDGWFKVHRSLQKID